MAYIANNQDGALGGALWVPRESRPKPSFTTVVSDGKKVPEAVTITATIKGSQKILNLHFNLRMR